MKISRTPVAVVAITALAIVPAAAFGKAKKGVYYQNINTDQVYIQNTSPSKVKLLQFPCINPAGGTSTAIVNGLKINSKGKVSKTATGTINGISSKTKIQVKIKISFSSKAKGTLTFPGANCNPLTFSAKYAGVNPQG